MKLSELSQKASALQKFIKLDIPAKKAFEMSKFIIAMNDQLRPYLETRNTLVKKYGEEKDGLLTVKQENIDAFLNDMESIDMDFIGEIPNIAIDDIKGEIDTETINILSFLIT